MVYEAERENTQKVVRTPGEDSDLALPDGWSTANTGAQLVLCRYFIERQSGPAVGSCEFLGSEGGRVTAPAVPTMWAFRLWEAKTARFVTGFELPGEYARCPQLNSIENGRASDLLSVPSDKRVTDRLRPWVEKLLP
ncbi:hypothetical protein P3102_20745 [Amycolatopsis sp. QT-25]|uniref:hypothetical protein n=1 Tax=Amycolatopsis sp. QT-25 TaxID=3034022 RepID=UPI0023ECDEF8|nr:hypothetical protein [Amycolatopsis sp. QT-25]WET76554.1 hypothetical protein P3102_20745 [Amycolatopsis sp. QT-25]